MNWGEAQRALEDGQAVDRESDSARWRLTGCYLAMTHPGKIMQYEDFGGTGIDGQVFEPAPEELAATDWAVA